MRRICPWLLLAVGASSGVATAGEYTEIGSALDASDPFDLHVTLSYGFESGTTVIKRERVGHELAVPEGQVPIVKDLVVRNQRHTLTPTMRVGIYTDVELSLSLPIVVHDSYTIELDQRGDCVFPGPGVPAASVTCTDRSNSSTIIDGILPAGGFDSNDPTTPFTDPADPTLFRGTERSGLDQLHVGLAWAPMNQRRDSTKPVWKIGAEFRIAIGDPMRFDRESPNRHTGAGRGLHELRLWTSMAKRISWSEPFVEFWWLAPLGRAPDSQFLEVGFGAEREGPQQAGGTRFGFEGIAWEDRDADQRVGVELSGHLEAQFEGRNYSPMWEVFAYGGSADHGGPLVLDENPELPGVQSLAHPGVTNIENYLTFGGRIALNAKIGPKVQFSTSFELLHNQAHIITFADAGIDLPQCQGGQTLGCEPDGDDTVDPGTEEVNPYQVPLIDQTGHRYRAEENTDFVLTVSGTVLF